MLGRIVEIAQDGRHVAVERGSLVVTEHGAEVGRVPLDDIAAVIANAHGLTYSNNLLVALAERNAAFVVCGANHMVAAILWPVDAHYQQSARIDAQLAASKPLNKRLWQQVVRAKLAQQAAVLEALGESSVLLTALIPKVKSGDPENIEAQGARRYWTRAFGEDFRRDRKADGVNALLNYGYTVLRAATARAIFANGLHPAIGLNHSSAGNAMRLVDDLMEPFRPIVDAKVYALTKRGLHEVNPESKRALAKVCYVDLASSAGATPIQSCLYLLAGSLARVYIGERDDLDIATPATALELQALLHE